MLARSSNPEGAVVQSAVTDEGSAVADHLLTEIALENAQEAPYGFVVQ